MSEPTATPTATEALAHREEVKREVLEFVKMVVWFLLLFALLKSCVIEGYEVQGPSMEPTLYEDERILVLKLPQKLSHLPLIGGYQAFDSGDVVVFESPDDSDKRYVKRVIAAGARQSRRNTVEAGAAGRTNTVEVLIEDGKVFINNQRLDEPYLGDAASGSDGAFRDVTLDPGTYFVLGDHRAVSKDSRSFGPVEEHTVIGKAVLRFWPLSRFGLLK